MADKIAPERSALLRALEPFIDRAEQLTPKLESTLAADGDAYLAMVDQLQTIRGSGRQTRPATNLDPTTRAILEDARSTFEAAQRRAAKPLEAAIEANSMERSALAELATAISGAKAFNRSAQDGFYLLARLRSASTQLDQIRDPDLRSWPLFADFPRFEAALAVHVMNSGIAELRSREADVHAPMNIFQLGLSVAAGNPLSEIDRLQATREVIAALAPHGSEALERVHLHKDALRLEDLRQIAEDAPSPAERRTAADLAARLPPSVRGARVASAEGSAAIELDIASLNAAKLEEMVPPVGTSKIYRYLGNGEELRGDYFAYVGPQDALVIAKGDGPLFKDFRVPILAAELPDVVDLLQRAGIELPDRIRAQLAAELWSPEGPVTRHAVKAAGAREQTTIVLELEGRGGRPAAELLQRRLPPLRAELDRRVLGKAQDGTRYIATVTKGGAIELTKVADRSSLPPAPIPAKELPAITALLAAIGIDLSSSTVDKLRAELWSPEGPVTRHRAIDAGEVRPLNGASNIAIRVKDLNGDQLNDLLFRRLEPVGPWSYLRSLGSAEGGAIFYAYAGSDGSIEIGKASTDETGALAERISIAPRELPAVVAALAKIGIDVGFD